MPADRIVRDAARAVLDSEHPVRVVDGDELVGVVDDEDILRVVVAEDEPSRSRTSAHAPTRPSSRTPCDDRDPEQPPTASEPEPAPEPAALASVARAVVRRLDASAGASSRAQATLALGGAGLTGVPELAQRASATRSTRRARTTGSSSTSSAASATSLDADRQLAAASCSASPAFPRPVPEIGWLGVVALVHLARLRAGRAAVGDPGARSALLLFGFLGYWPDSIDTLIVTVVAVLDLRDRSASRSASGWPAARRRSAVITPVLDVMQTMPSFAYLAPLVLFFGIGPASAVVCTLIYALPPLVRITAHGIRTVSADDHRGRPLDGPDPVAAAAHRCSCRWPGAPSSSGLNQCTMAALSMATIAALINGPGLGQPVVAGAAEPGRRRRVRRRPRHRDHGDHARPDHHRGQRAGRGGRPAAGAATTANAAPDRR